MLVYKNMFPVYNFAIHLYKKLFLVYKNIKMLYKITFSLYVFIFHVYKKAFLVYEN